MVFPNGKRGIKMRTLHACKQAVIYIMIFGMFLSNTGPLLCRTQDQRARLHGSLLNKDSHRNVKALLASLGTRSVHKDHDARLARPDVPSFPGSKPTQVVSPIDYATLKVMQECLCVIKDCVQQIKESLVFIVEPDAWFSLIDAIECSHIDAPTTPANLAEGQLLLAEGITELLERVGCLDDEVPTPNAILDVNTTTTYTVIQWLKAIYHKVK